MSSSEIRDMFMVDARSNIFVRYLQQQGQSSAKPADHIHRLS